MALRGDFDHHLDATVRAIDALNKEIDEARRSATCKRALSHHMKAARERGKVTAHSFSDEGIDDALVDELVAGQNAYFDSTEKFFWNCVRDLKA